MSCGPLLKFYAWDELVGMRRFASVAAAFLMTAGPMTQVKELPLKIETKTSPSAVHISEFS